MEANNNIEKAYDLVEQFEFSELSKTDKSYILSIMTEAQYTKMRRTITDIKVSLENDIEPILNMPQAKSNKNKLLQLANYPIRFYKVAASIAIIMAIYFMVQKSTQNQTNQLIARNDTVIIHQIDTVYTKVYDTIRIIKSNVRSVQVGILQSENLGLITQPNQSSDCNKELCPNEIGRIISMSNKNNISSDSALNGLLVSLNN